MKISKKILLENINNFEIEVANDNSNGQIVLSGRNLDIQKFIVLKSKNIRNLRLPVSAPFHCKLMNKATKIMEEEIKDEFSKMEKTNLFLMLLLMKYQTKRN